jgi:fructose-1-phosphate kinase PfkB-like protein
LISIAAACKVPVFLDSSGEPLRQGIELARPYLIKPNAREFAGLLEITDSVGTPGSLPEAALTLSIEKSIIVAVSLGADGLLVADKTSVFQVKPPDVAARSAVGSGDCVMAGLAYGITHGFTLHEAARYGVAAGTANTLSIGAGNFSIDEFHRILAGVTLEALP